MYSLKVKIIEARNLLGKDRSGLSDPFCVLQIGNITCKSEVKLKTLYPVWNQEFEFQIKPELIKDNLSIELFDKDLVGKDFLGAVSIPITRIIQKSPLYAESCQSPEEYYLQSNSDHNLDSVKGSVVIAAGFTSLPEILIEMYQNQDDGMNFSLDQDKSSSDEDMYFNQFLGDTIDDSEVLEKDSTIMVTEQNQDNNTYSSSTEQLSNEVLGLLRIDIQSAQNLPRLPNLLQTTWDSDPFVIISFGAKVFKTRKVRHTLNPVWNERLYLQVTRKELDMNHSITFHIYDHDKITNHDSIGLCKIKIKDVVENCPHSTNLPDVPSRMESVSLTLPVQLTVPIRKLKEPTESILKLSTSFMTYKDIRRNFWISLAKVFDSDNKGKMNRVELVTMLDAIGSTFSQESIDKIFHPYAEWTYEEVFESIEDLLNSTSPEVSLEAEHLVQMRHCPLCKKKISLKHDLNTVSHIALCSFNDFGKMDSFVMSGFLTESYTSRKWYTKIISYVAHGSYGIGKNNANIIVKNRETGQLFEEKIPAYIRLGIRLLYQRAGSTAVDRQTIRNLLQSLTNKQGRKFNDPSSVKHIASFIKFHRLDISEMKLSLDDFKNFNEFFYRELKEGARRVASPDPNIAVSPADCRLMVFPTIGDATELWIKGKNFTMQKLLEDKEKAERFKDGSIAIFRLAPQDYHRFHIPVDGTISEPKNIEGDYFTVNPMAIRTSVDVYTDNVRSISYIDSPIFGLVAYVCVGAMMVGSIKLTSNPNQKVSRIQEHGYFAFGGSTILLLFEKDKIVFDKDLVENSNQCLESLVKVGHSIGISKQVC